jgi:succinoglycan biosynthesis protein ExoW
MPVISVIIPYYQREAGHLPRAVHSALRQQDVESPAIIIVDDGSPLPAEAELTMLNAEEREHVHLVRQTNQGPGPARNAGLNAVDRETEWIAFLDSDDAWENCHLARALTALREGYDFFFSNLLRDGDPETHFGLTGFDPFAHRPLLVDPSLFAYSGDFFGDNLTFSPVGTSTVVMRNSVLGGLRFWSTRDTPGEDLTLWLEAAQTTTRIAFDSTVQVRYGKGSITNAFCWKSAQALRSNVGYGKYIAETARRFSLDESQAALVTRLKRENRAAVTQIVLAMLREGRLADTALFGSYLLRDPAVITDLMRVLGNEGLRRIWRHRRVGV